jgi:hypothetical protein
VCTCGTNPPKIGYPQKRKNERRQPDTWSEGAAQAQQVRQTFYDTPKVTFMSHDAPWGSGRGWGSTCAEHWDKRGCFFFQKKNEKHTKWVG